MPLAPLIQYGVQGGPLSVEGGLLQKSVTELREMLKLQQAQLDQLTKSFAML